MYKFTLISVLSFLVFYVNPPAPVATQALKVIAIADGDTFTVLQGKKPIRVRIDAIDAPEKGMPYYKVSKKYLSTLCFGKMVILKSSKRDQYGRTVARVQLPNGKDVSTEMIKAGLAWHYQAYSSDKRLSAYEQLARKNKLGLWKDADPMAPWTVRKLHRQGISTKGRFKNRVE